ncbi:hypothetical protein FC78_GL001604 [Companilactobacillus bobalius DSM 19674]|uniref:Uncharacterized protein n=2 Tax=Companilactobacillus bobalius TaxID=2801451 RepID=A0A0R1L171_9LACO|nr:hypothetical protein FC78_GL001604 [Companilactobacillus bobalius DSM 19674]
MVGIKLLGEIKMLTLETKKGIVTPTFNYLLYKNIAGEDKDKRTDKFNSFLDGLFSDNVDSVITFFKAVAGNLLKEDELVDQLSEDGRFDDIHEVTSEIIKGLIDAGFLKAKISEWMRYGDRLIKGMKKSLELKSVKTEEKEMTQIQIDQLEENMKEANKRIKEASK